MLQFGRDRATYLLPLPGTRTHYPLPHHTLARVLSLKTSKTVSATKKKTYIHLDMSLQILAMALGPRNSVFIAVHPNNILRIDVQGKTLCAWRLLHQVGETRSLAVTHDKVFVCCDHVLQMYTLVGRLLREWSICSNPGPVAANDDHVYVADLKANCVRAFRHDDSFRFLFSVRAFDLQSLVVCACELFLAGGWGVYIFGASDGVFLRAMCFAYDIWNLAIADDGRLAMLFSSGTDIDTVNLDGQRRKRVFCPAVGTQFLVFTNPMLVSHGFRLEEIHDLAA